MTLVKCTSCGADMEVGAPAIELSNAKTVSVITINHLAMGDLTCKKCGAQHLSVVMGFKPEGLNVQMLPMPLEMEEKKIITLN